MLRIPVIYGVQSTLTTFPRSQIVTSNLSVQRENGCACLSIGRKWLRFVGGDMEVTGWLYLLPSKNRVAAHV